MNLILSFAHFCCVAANHIFSLLLIYFISVVCALFHDLLDQQFCIHLHDVAVLNVSRSTTNDFLFIFLVLFTAFMFTVFFSLFFLVCSFVSSWVWNVCMHMYVCVCTARWTSSGCVCVCLLICICVYALF